MKEIKLYFDEDGNIKVVKEDESEICSENSESQRKDVFCEVSEVSNLLEQINGKLDRLLDTEHEDNDISGKVILDIDKKIDSFIETIEMHKNIESDMNRELNKYKNDYYGSTLSPLLADVCRLHSDISDVYDQYHEAYEKEKSDMLDEFLSSLKFYKKNLEMTLRRYQVKAVSAELFSEPDVNFHQVVGAVSTDDTSLEGKIAEVKGYIYIRNENTVIMPAMVKLFRTES